MRQANTAAHSSQGGAADLGSRLRGAFSMPRAPVLSVRDLRFGPMAVAELRYDGDNYGRSEPIPATDAVLVSLQLRSSSRHVVWEDGKQLPIVPLGCGMSSLLDLRRAVTAQSMQPFHNVTFAVPLRALDGSDEASLRDISLRDPSRFGFDDAVIRGLGAALLPALADPEAASRLFVEHVLLALHAHLARRFGVAAGRARRSGLASWQERRAKELIEARLAENVSLGDLARECALSVAQFARSFKRSTGIAPYQFLTARRIERARDLLLHTELSLADVAARCGFADQSHFTKVFRRVMGGSPGNFRATYKPHG